MADGIPGVPDQGEALDALMDLELILARLCGEKNPANMEKERERWQIVLDEAGGEDTKKLLKVARQRITPLNQHIGGFE